MSSAIYGLLFVAGTSVSLLAGWQLVAALERVGGRVGLSEGALGMLAALAADAPEITAAVSALAAGNHHVGAGVVIGSNLFNLASLIGVAGIVGGFIALDRRVVRFAGVIAAWVALMALAAATGALSPALTLALSLIVFVPYIAVLTLSPERLDRLARHDRVRGALAGAVIAEETEMQLGNESRRGRATHFDALLALGLTLLVVLASVVMERSATTLGTRAQVPAIVVGALALAAVTSLPNAVAGVYLARRGRGAAVLSTSLNSNSINVIAGLLIPTTILGIGPASSATTYVAAAALLMTLFTLAVCHVRGGITRAGGWLVVGFYAAFVAVLLTAS
jgi:cation:H+ antiporter